jgi:hypothetical protein
VVEVEGSRFGKLKRIRVPTENREEPRKKCSYDWERVFSPVVVA